MILTVMGRQIDLSDDLDPLISRVVQSTPLSAAEAERVVLDVIMYMSETPEDFVTRRHSELRNAGGLHNDAIFALLSEELAGRVFKVQAFSARQLRRIIYG